MKRFLSALATVAALGASLVSVSVSTARAQQPATAVPIPARADTGAQPGPDLKVNWIVAVVGNRPILWSEVLEVINQRRAQGLQVPTDSGAQMELARSVANELIDEEVLVAQAANLKVEVTYDEVNQSVDKQLKRVHDQFKSESEFREALKGEGFGTPEEYKKSLAEQARRAALQQRVIDKLRQDGKLVSVAVSDADVQKAFEQNKATLPKRPATVTFRQIIIAPRPSEAAKARARAKAESLLVEIQKGGDFEQIAKRASMDPGTKDLGGDLGWNRRGVMVPEFDRWMFALNPGQLSPVIETSFGYHIIKVDRVQPAEVKARHILIRPEIDSADVARARLEADSVAKAWRAGASFDTLAAKHHDPAEFRSILDPYPREQLPQSYQTAFGDKPAGTILDPFQIEDQRSGKPKFVVAQLVTVAEGGDYTASDLHLREQLGQERSIRRLIDQLRKTMYISLRI